MEVQELIRKAIDQASAKTIFGEPVSIPGKTVVPVARIRAGFGSGRNGGGGGFVGKPVGVVEITPEQTRFISISSKWALLAVFGAGVALGYLLAPRRVDVRVERTARD